MSKEEWCADKLSKLLNEELRISTLNDMKNHLQSLPVHERKSLLNHLDLPLVFDCLNDTKTEQVELACEVLSLCLENLEIGESADRYRISLERALVHPYPPVKLMVLRELEQNIKNEDILISLSKQTSLLTSIIRCLGSEDLSVANRTCNILFILGCSDNGIKHLTSMESVKVFHEVQKVNDVICLRVFEVLINISKESISSFQHLNAAGLISPIMDNLNNNDILFRRNIIEILSQLANSENGFHYLESLKVMNILSEMLNNSDLLSLRLIEPGILKFFGSIGHWKPKAIVGEYTFVLKRMFENFNSCDINCLGVSLDAIGYIAASSDGKCALDSLQMVEDGISVISKRLSSFPTEMKVRILKMLENLLQLEEVIHEEMQISTICRRWYFAIGKDPMTETVLQYAKNPFPELRVAGLRLLSVISDQIWGQEIIKDTPGLIEFLLDRNVETDKESKELKYGIVRTLNSSSIFDQNICKKLDIFVKEGPFYVRGVMEVELEGNV